MLLHSNYLSIRILRNRWVIGLLLFNGTSLLAQSSAPSCVYKVGQSTIVELEYGQEENARLVQISSEETDLLAPLPQAYPSDLIVQPKLSVRHHAGTTYLNCLSISNQKTGLLIFERSDNGAEFHTVAIKKQPSSPFPIKVSYPCVDTISSISSTVYRVLYMRVNGAFQYSEVSQ